MKTPTKHQTIVKIFIGFELTKAVSSELNKSPNWKKAFIAQGSSEIQLAKVPYKGKEFAGLYAKYPMINTHDLFKQADQIKQFLQGCCPEFKGEKLPILIFSQVFIS